MSVISWSAVVPWLASPLLLGCSEKVMEGRPAIVPLDHAHVQVHRRSERYQSLYINLDNGAMSSASGPHNCDVKRKTVTLEDAELVQGRALFARERVASYEGARSDASLPPKDPDLGQRSSGVCQIGSSVGVRLSVSLPPGTDDVFLMEYPSGSSSEPRTQEMLVFLDRLSRK
jgi:hypothetical protein